MPSAILLYLYLHFVPEDKNNWKVCQLKYTSNSRDFFILIRKQEEREQEKTTLDMEISKKANLSRKRGKTEKEIHVQGIKKSKQCKQASEIMHLLNFIFYMKAEMAPSLPMGNKAIL